MKIIIISTRIQEWKMAFNIGDLPEFMDFEYLRKNTALNLSNLANLAKAPPAPDSVKIDVKNLSNLTHLSWKASGSRKGKGLLCDDA